MHIITYRILHQQGRFSVNLRKECWDKFDITVICVVPSYLGTVEERYKTQKYYKENINGVKILRIAILQVPEFRKKNK